MIVQFCVSCGCYVNNGFCACDLHEEDPKPNDPITYRAVNQRNGKVVELTLSRSNWEEIFRLAGVDENP